ncbi:MAG: ABC transporter permease [Candidatus Brocadiae bacterium]|nr:ABC transporter permease [Candidatus Brocadiia bacterium]
MLDSIKPLVFQTAMMVLIITLCFILVQREIFFLAIKNLTKNLRRTLILFCVIISGLVGLIEFFGYAENMIYGLREGTIRGGLGHVQIYKKGYNATGNVDKLEYNIHNYDEIAKMLEKDAIIQNKIQTIGAELYFSGILASSKTSSIFVGKGIEIDKDKLISEADEMVIGKPLQKVDQKFDRKQEVSRLKEYEGMFESFELDKKIAVDVAKIWTPKADKQQTDNPSLDDALIGTGLASALGAQLGDTLTLMVATKTGGLNALDINVRGIIKGSSKEYNDSILKMSLPYAWVLMNRKDVSRINILLKDTEYTDEIHKRVQNIIQSNNLDLETTTWQDLALFYNNVHMFFVTMFITIGMVIITVVFFAIANVITMSVSERVREIGTLRSMGETKWGIMQIFMMEAIVIGMAGGVLSVLFGIGFAEFVNQILGGIPHPPPPGSTESYRATFFVLNRPLIWGIAFLLAFFSAFFSSVLPARKASNMEIVDSLRYT